MPEEEEEEEEDGIAPAKEDKQGKEVATAAAAAEDDDETEEELEARRARNIRIKRAESHAEDGETPKSAGASSPPRKKLRSTIRGPFRMPAPRLDDRKKGELLILISLIPSVLDYQLLYYF